MSITVNDLRSTKFGLRNPSGFTTNGDLQAFVVNDLKLLLSAINGVSGSTFFKQASYTIGAPGLAGCDYNFTSAANANEQSIQLGATTIIPSASPIQSIKYQTLATLVGGTETSDIGNTSGGDEYISSIDMSALNTIGSAGSFPAVNGASSVYFSATPSANWNTLSLWKVKVTIYYIDGTVAP
jgi:hypothetical protein